MTAYAVLVAMTMASGRSPVAQRPVLPHNLKSGRHDVSVRHMQVRDAPVTAWYAAACGRRTPAPTSPCADAPADSGPLPMLVILIGATGPTREDSTLAAYLASHGYIAAVVPLLPSPSGASPELDEPLLRSLGSLAPVDSLRIAVAARRPGVPLAKMGRRPWPVRAVLELDPGHLVVRTPASGFTLVLPPSADPLRLTPVLTHLLLNSVLRQWGDSLPELVRRLRARGLGPLRTGGGER